MSEIPEDLKYTESHEWILVDGDEATIGISDHAQAELTDVVFVELPDVGRKVALGEACAVVESVKTASDIYSPLSGEVIQINEEVTENPGLVNESPYKDGWFFKLKLKDEGELDRLMDATAYRAHIGE